MNTAYVQGQTAQSGELKLAILTGTGPASYNAGTGDILYNPGAGDYIECPQECCTQSGTYELIPYPVTAGYLRAGAPSPSQSGWRWIWVWSGKQGVTVVQNVAGSGMTVGTVVPIVFAGGTGGGAVGTVTVLTATTISITLTQTGSYTAAPTATVSGTGGTPPTLTVALQPVSGPVANGTNLSAEVVQFGAIVSQL
jgi:hypothetical protein